MVDYPNYEPCDFHISFEQELHEIQFYNHQVLFSNLANDYAKDSLQLIALRNSN